MRSYEIDPILYHSNAAALTPLALSAAWLVAEGDGVRARAAYKREET